MTYRSGVGLESLQESHCWLVSNCSFSIKWHRVGPIQKPSSNDSSLVLREPPDMLYNNAGLPVAAHFFAMDDEERLGRILAGWVW
jgi:hypothetical protein